MSTAKKAAQKKRKRGRPTGKTGAASGNPDSVKVSVFLSPDLNRRVTVAAAKAGLSKYAFLSDLISKNVPPVR